MAWTQDDIPDLTGRVAVVTGANGGLGYETALALAAHGAHVVMAVRNQTKAAEAEARIRAAHPDASLELVALDLGDQSSVRRAAETILAAHPVIDVLVNNAGLMAMPERQTADGYEMQFGVNHLGHWTLTALLLPGLLRADAAGRDARVVTVTSVARFVGSAVDPENPHLRGAYEPWGSYGQAKLSNYYFGLGLQRRFEDARVGVKSLLAHPGLSNTDLQAHTVEEGGGGIWGPFFHVLTTTFGMRPDQGARMQLRAATDPSASGGRAVRTGLRQPRTAGHTTHPAPDRDGRRHRDPLGGVRARDRRRPRRVRGPGSTGELSARRSPGGPDDHGAPVLARLRADPRTRSVDMAEVTETQLPGVGIRYEFSTSEGDRVGVLHHHGGRREVFVQDADDPDVARTVLRLGPDDCHTLTELLGASQVTESVGELRHRIEGLTIDWIDVGAESEQAGRSIGEGALRTRTGASVIAVIHGDTTEPAPGPDVVLQAGDVAVVVGTGEGLEQLRQVLRG